MAICFFLLKVNRKCWKFISQNEYILYLFKLQKSSWPPNNMNRAKYEILTFNLFLNTYTFCFRIVKKMLAFISSIFAWLKTERNSHNSYAKQFCFLDILGQKNVFQENIKYPIMLHGLGDHKDEIKLKIILFPHKIYCQVQWIQINLNIHILHEFEIPYFHNIQIISYLWQTWHKSKQMKIFFRRPQHIWLVKRCGY